MLAFVSGSGSSFPMEESTPTDANMTGWSWLVPSLGFRSWSAVSSRAKSTRMLSGSFVKFGSAGSNRLTRTSPAGSTVSRFRIDSKPWIARFAIPSFPPSTSAVGWRRSLLFVESSAQRPPSWSKVSVQIV